MVEPLNLNLNLKIRPTAPVVFLNGIKSLLYKFTEVFKVPIGLPSTKAQDN